MDGGDRDGNPLLHQKLLRKSCFYQDGKAKLYEKSLTKLIRSFSMQKCPKKY